MRNSVEAIDPGGTHWARYGLLLAVHEVVNDERTIGRSEQLAQLYLSHRFVALVERHWAWGSSPTVRKGSAIAVQKLVILNRRTLWKSPSQRGNSFTRV